MIHNHYRPEQILWFLRHYWQFNRDGIIAEWRRYFEDDIFGKSQYNWLKSRYGMKAEWGAALNDPPFPGAKPGAPGTENYIAPGVPVNPPRATFRTRSDSPTPVLISAPATAASHASVVHSHAGEARHPAHAHFTGQAHPAGHSIGGTVGISTSGSGFSHNNRSSTGAMHVAGMNQSSSTGYPGAMGLTGPTATPLAANTTGPTPLATPVMTPVMPAAGPGSYIMSNNPTKSGNQATPRSLSGAVTSSNGTYNFGSSIGNMPGLGSPFMPTGANMSMFNPMNPIVSSFTMGPASSMPNLNGSFSFTYGGPSQQSFQQFPGDYSNSPNAAQENFSHESGFSGLGISLGPGNPANHHFQASSTGPVPDHPNAMNMAAQMPIRSATTGHSAKSQPANQPVNATAGAHIPTNAEIIANVMLGHNPVSSVVEAIVSPQGDLGRFETGKKRKRSAVEVEFQPPKRANMASEDDKDGYSFRLMTTDLPAEAAAPKANKKPSKPRAKKSTSPQASASPSVTSTVSTTPLQPSDLPTEQPNSVPSVAAAEPRVPQDCAPGPVELSGTWHDRSHDNCSMNGRHLHITGGGIFFAESADFKKAAASHTSGGTNTPAAPATTGPSTAGPPTPVVPVTVDAPSDASSDMTVQGFVTKVDPDSTGICQVIAQSPEQNPMDLEPMPAQHKEDIVAPVEPKTAALVDTSQDGYNRSTTDEFGMDDNDYLLISQVGSSLYQNEQSDVETPCTQGAPLPIEGVVDGEDYSDMVNCSHFHDSDDPDYTTFHAFFNLNA
ncbi:hypothetical protein SEUCBS140593_004120 [Sporothrix eucalyptigena]|uniref:Clr5 domain-containing protein n=1 Tax=Sporothrix eucalyptigena TaxID=1812306 RepID=A0ABP0BKE7_9PEZI